MARRPRFESDTGQLVQPDGYHDVVVTLDTVERGVPSTRTEKGDPSKRTAVEEPAYTRPAISRPGEWTAFFG